MGLDDTEPDLDGISVHRTKLVSRGPNSWVVRFGVGAFWVWAAGLGGRTALRVMWTASVHTGPDWWVAPSLEPGWQQSAAVFCVGFEG
jgi:hypothetical protein